MCALHVNVNVSVNVSGFLKENEWVEDTSAEQTHEEPRQGMEQHTFVNHLASLLEDLDRWEADDECTKKDMVMGTRTKLLLAMRAGMVHPFTTFYALEASTVIQSTVNQSTVTQDKV